MIHLKQSEVRFNILAKVLYINGFVNWVGVTVFASDEAEAEEQADELIETWNDVKEYTIHDVTMIGLGLKKYDIESEIIYRNSKNSKHVFVTFSAQTPELAKEVAYETLRGWKDVQYVKIIQVVLKPAKT